MTINVHPLYLPPVVCWLNRTCVQVRHAKGVMFNVLKVISSVLVFTTLFVHIIRLWNLFSWGLLGAMWSLMVCITLIGGSILTVLSSERRSSRSDTSVIADPMSGVSGSQKLIMFMLFVVTYIYTWLYYTVCSGTNVVVLRIECSSKQDASLFPVLKWTTFVFVWINTIGFIRLLNPS